jgi:hypothetical protein
MLESILYYPIPQIMLVGLQSFYLGLEISLHDNIRPKVNVYKSGLLWALEYYLLNNTFFFYDLNIPQYFWILCALVSLGSDLYYHDKVTFEKYNMLISIIYYIVFIIIYLTGNFLLT